MVFHWSLSDSKSPQVSRIRLRILVVLSNAVVWIVSVRPPISKSSRPFNKPLVVGKNAPITIGTIVTFMFHSFFLILKQGRGTSPSFHILSVLFCGQLGLLLLLILLLSLLLLLSTFRVFHISVSWLVFNGVRVIASIQNYSHYSGHSQ